MEESQNTPSIFLIIVLLYNTLVNKFTFYDEHATALSADHQPAVGPRVTASDVVPEVRVKTLRFPRGALEQAGGRQAGGSVPLDDGVELQGLTDAHELHLPGLLFAARASGWVREHVTERSPVQHRLQN